MACGGGELASKDKQMLKRVLVLLGETLSSVSARQYAFHLARETGAELTGLAGVDLAFIERGEAVPLGAMAFKVERDRELRRQAEAARIRLHELFADECKARGVPFSWLTFEDDPIPVLYLATEIRDLVVTGHDTAFHGKLRENLPEMLSELVRSSPRPTVLCADRSSQGQDILVAYDGSLPSMRAVQMFALLGISSTGRRMYILSADASEELATRKATGAATYLESHGLAAEPIPLTSRGEPSELIREVVADRLIGTIVMGAYGH
jgi:hypothetical protein